MGAFGGWPSSLRNCLPPFVGVNVVRPRRAWSADAALAGLRALHIDASSLRQDGSYRGKPGSGQAAPGGPTGLLCCGVVHEVARVTGGHRCCVENTGRDRRRRRPATRLGVSADAVHNWISTNDLPVRGGPATGSPFWWGPGHRKDQPSNGSRNRTSSTDHRLGPRPSGQDHERPPSPDTGRGHPETSVRNDTVTIATTVCAQCGASFTPAGRRSWRGWVWSGCCPAAAPGGFAGRRRSTIGR